MRSLFLIDGLNQIFRAYYAPFQPLTSSTGEPTKTVYVFLNMLTSLIREKQPDYLAVTLEGGDVGQDFRRQIDPEYKANRNKLPDDFKPQVDRIKEILAALGIPVFHIPGFEADDLMASIAKQTSDEDELKVFMVSSDKDLRQLLSETVCLFNPKKQTVLDASSLAEEHGYTPMEAIEIQTLTGDTTDNVPGVRGIGAKTALKLIKKYGSAESVVEHADELTPKQRENVLAFAGQLPITRSLITLRDDIPFEFDLEQCVLDLDVETAEPILEELGLKRIIDRLYQIPLS